MIFPAVIEKRYSVIDCLLHHADRHLYVLRVSQVMSPKPERRHFNLMTPEFAQRYSAAWLLSRCCMPLVHGASPNATVKHSFDECGLGKFAGALTLFVA